MQITEPQAIQVINEAEEITMQLKSMVRTLETCNKRMRMLRSKEVHLETIFVAAQIVEHYLKMLIDGYGSRRRVLHILQQPDAFDGVTLSYRDDQALGDLIGTLRSHKANSNLLRKLGHFNGIRKEAVHHIFDGSREVEKFEQEVKEYLSGEEFSSILNEILAEHGKIGDSIHKMVRPTGFESAKDQKKS